MPNAKNRITKSVTDDQIIKKSDIIGLFFGRGLFCLVTFLIPEMPIWFKLYTLLDYVISLTGWLIGWYTCIYRLSIKEDTIQAKLDRNEITNNKILESLAIMTEQIKTISTHQNKK